MCTNGHHSNGYAWARGITTAVIAILFLAVVYAATYNERDVVLMTPKGICMMIAGQSNAYIAKHGRGTDCEAESAVVWVDETLIYQRVYYQVQDSPRYCMTDRCHGMRETCATSMVTFEPCVEEQRNQLWMRPSVKALSMNSQYSTFKYWSVAAAESGDTENLCLTSSLSYRSIDNTLFVDDCKDNKSMPPTQEQDWAFFEENPQVKINTAAGVTSYSSSSSSSSLLTTKSLL